MTNEIKKGVPASPTPGSTPAPAPDAKKGAPEHSSPPYMMIGPEGDSVVGRDSERARAAAGDTFKDFVMRMFESMRQLGYTSGHVSGHMQGYSSGYHDGMLRGYALAVEHVKGIIADEKAVIPDSLDALVGGEKAN